MTIFMIVIPRVRDGIQGSKGLYVLLGAANVILWAAAYGAFGAAPLLWNAAVLAYALGLRHAFDADHIAAIDNVIRRLLNEGRNTSFVGMWFSLGHSTVVLLFCAAIGFAIDSRIGSAEKLGVLPGIFGSSASAIFLLAVGISNVFVLRGVWRQLVRMRSGAAFPGTTSRARFGLVRAPWQMYLVGLLFGLAFDTATEVGLLSISARASAEGMSIKPLLLFPALFAAGMALMDTFVSSLMGGVYGAASKSAERTLRYSLVVTAIPIAAALIVGGVQLSNLLAGHLGAQGVTSYGYGIVAACAGIWGFFRVREKQAAPNQNRARRSATTVRCGNG